MNKLEDALDLLELSLNEHKANPDNQVIIAGVIKAFEISFEYIWKGFKQVGAAAGNEIYSPRDAIKSAAEMGLIDDFEVWKKFLNSRNLSVHDYLGVTSQELLSLAKDFLKEAKKVSKKLNA
jgi:nucleotidyltransferase substrate binding protein (TIGR01987 family)